MKLVWASRSASDFLQFQYTSIGSSVSSNDTICILPKFKKQEDFVEFLTHPQTLDQRLKFHEVVGEVDELVISFHTKNNQIKNLTNIVLPCMMVPIVFCLSDDRESKIQLLLAAILTMVFTMPASFNMGTTLWYLKSIVLIVIAFIAPTTRFDIQWISILTTSLLLIRNFYLQKRFASLNKLSIKDLTKDAIKENDFDNIWKYFDLR